MASVSRELILPVLVLVLYDFGYVARITRASMVEVMTSRTYALPCRRADRIGGSFVSTARRADHARDGLLLHVNCHGLCHRRRVLLRLQGVSVR